MDKSPAKENKQTNNYRQFKDHRSNKSYKILVLDDEEDICLLISSILRKLGHQVICSHSLKEGKSDFTSFAPDLMFLDINLPDGNGLDDVPSFQNLNHDVRIIMISAYDFPQEMKMSEKLHVEFLRKPFNREKILQAIQTIS